MLMHIAVVVLVLALSYLAYKNWVGRRSELYLANFGNAQSILATHRLEQIKKLQEDLVAMEEGRQEQEDNYEQQFLTFEEHLVAQAHEIQRLEAYLEKHDRECLPDIQELRWKALSGAVENA